ncbi:hypothetical protein Tco_1044536 [Tanacetum coccineum]|uniref:Gag-Pol polyprotein n=1 Tax=Tanacetum coccineum TaxID=301880 RepID=A0ABQ5GQ64_9ASTR
MLFGLMFYEYLNEATQVVLKSFAVTTTDASDKRQQHNTTPSTSITVDVDLTHLDIQTILEPITQTPIVNAIVNINQAENVIVDEDEFINIFGTQLDTNGKMCMFALTMSRVEPKNIKEAMFDHAWIEAMYEELHQFKRLNVCELVDRPYYKNVINMKQLWKNKCDEENTVIRNKAHLVAKGHR